MKNETLKNFYKAYKEYLIETDHSANTSDQYCTYLRKACALLNLGEGFIEAIIAISDIKTQAALCEYLMARLSDAFEKNNTNIPKKHISNYKSAVATLSAFIVKEEIAESTTEACSSFLPAITLPCESVYTQQDIIRIFKQRLVTQDRYYATSCLPVRIITKINRNSVKKDIYKNIILNTKFLYDKDANKFFRLSEITKLTIKTDGFVKIEVKGKEYDVYTEIYSKGKFIGYEPIRVDSFALLSLDHVLPVHSELQKFLPTHSEFKKFSDNIISYKESCPEMTIAQFSTDYFEKVYPSLSVDESILMDEIRTFIDSLELTILHRSFNSSKNDNVPIN